MRRLATVLLGAALPFTTLDHHLALVDAQGLRDRRQRIKQPRLGLFRVNRARRGVFLHMHPIAIQVDGHGVLGHIGVVQAVAVHAFAARPLAQLLEVLLQAVGKHLPAFAQPGLLLHHRLGALLATGDLLALDLALLRGAALASDELLRQHLDQQQLARQGAVPEGVLFVAANAHALAQVRGAGEHRRFPVHAGLTQTLAEILVEVQQAGLIAQALTIGRVTDHQTGLVLVRTRLEGSQFALVDLDPVRQPGALDVVAPRLDQARIGLITTNPQRRLGQARGGALFGLGVQALPEGRHVAEPGREAPALTLEVGRDIGGDHRRFHQEGTDTAHRVGQRPASGGNPWPAGADQHRGGEVFLQRRGALLQAVTTLVQAVTG